ncbi:MAG: hypothetical protein JWR89_2429 [Tardiphaga sp.]|uniref:hypothetical protein n=1 Tax=Tardiphaga sp. TaxID=1926292 RepID=UPI002604E596|nr:hypothetical protein [Tardiphaga sp.]MDB5502527.1 hypothetical protein [Tardiphaga sp.]
MSFSEINPHSEESKAALARAFDAAWQRFIALEGEAADTADNRSRLASHIVALAKSGQSDEDALGEAGLIYLRVLSEAQRLGQRHRQDVAHAPSPTLAANWHDEGGHSFGPETVAAMSAALNRCLDVLPLHIPADALKLLSTSILDAASRGERDAERLHLHALEMLKART